MTIKQKIWSIPLLTILIFSIGIVFVYKSSSYTYDLLQRTGLIHYPFLQKIQILSDELLDIQEGFLDALDTNRKAGITRAQHNAEVFRQAAKSVAAIDGKNEISQEILAEFNDYFTSAESAASILIGIKQGDGMAEMGQMAVALNKLTNTLQREHLAATLSFEQSLSESKNNVQKMLWVSLLSVFFVLLGLAFTSYYLISSILTNLEHLRAGASKIAQGDFATRIPVRGKDELTLVAQSFNSMGEELQVATEKRIQYQKQLETLNLELEGRVQTRTAELAVALEDAYKANAAVAYRGRLTKGKLKYAKTNSVVRRWFYRPSSLCDPIRTNSSTSSFGFR